jgi:DNA-binding FrmR family transcriptional regulator
MDSITQALNRIEGQVRGIKKMYQEERECAQIAQQVAAIQNALKRVATQLLTDEAVRCTGAKSSRKDLYKVIESAVKIS